MKLEKYKDKKETRKKVMLISLTVLTLVSVTMMLYKTFAKFTTTTSFPIMSGKVIYKKKGLELGKDIKPSQDGSTNGLFAVTHTAPTGWEATEYRYAGPNPDNYIYFNCKDGTEVQNSANCELWRIIGLVNVKIYNSETIEQRLKIIRKDSIGQYSWNCQGGLGDNDWTWASLMGILNSTYYNSLNESCYKLDDDTSSCKAYQCNYTQNQSIRGLSSKAKDMIEGDNLSWNITGWGDYANSDEMYRFERVGSVYSDRYTPRAREWNVGTAKNPTTKKPDSNFFRGVGLMYPSDYGYSVGGSLRSSCISTILYNYGSSCSTYNWLYSNGSEWLLSPNSSNYNEAFTRDNDGSAHPLRYTYVNETVRPVVYINQKFKIISGTGTQGDPFVLSE